MRKTNGKGAQSLEQWLHAVGQVCTKKRQAKGECNRSNSPEVLAARRMIDDTPASRRSQFAREQQAKRRKRNPDATAEEMFEAFTGKPSTKSTVITEKVHSPARLADLGELIEIAVILPEGRHVAAIGFEARGVRLAAARFSKDGDATIASELHIVGGDQEIDLRKLEAQAQAGKPSIVLGTAHTIAYRTSKHFHNFKESVYEHELGEETGEKPVLCYDPRSRKLYLAGGAYVVRPEGIVN